MGSPYKNFKTDNQMETEGIWLDYGDFKIRIARAGGSNVRYAKAVERHATQHKTALRNDILSAEQQKEIMIQVYADSIILEWESMEDEDGNALPFSRENVVKVLTDLPDLFADIRQQATTMGLFRKELLEKAAKNS